MTNERFAAMNIVNQLFDLAEVPVAKRQAINDQADVFVQSIIGHLLRQEEGEPRQGGEPSGLVWSREKPTAEGWYWVRLGEDKPIDIVEVALAGLNRFEYWSHFYDSYTEIPDDWIWAGPIPAPRTQAAQPPAEAPEAEQTKKEGEV